jgi:hypothetical protein
MGQFETHAAQQDGLLDHLVGAGEQCRRHGESHAFAVWRLTTRRNFTGRSIGKSAGFAPLESCPRRLLRDDSSLLDRGHSSSGHQPGLTQG